MGAGIFFIESNHVYLYPVTIEEAINLISPAVILPEGIWADIGAGTGVFTQALMQILKAGKVFAVDKSPHMLWNLPAHGPVEMEVVEADFNDPLPLPLLEGVLMANTLHYAQNPLHVLRNIRLSMKEQASFILIEYETETPLHPWVPFPVPFQKCTELFIEAGFGTPEIKNSHPSVYNSDHMYVALAFAE